MRKLTLFILLVFSFPASAIDLVITAASVVPAADAVVVDATAGATLTAGQLVYQDTADSNKMKLSDAQTATAAARTVYGLTLNGASNGQPVKILRSGTVTIGATVATGQVYAMSAAAGMICPYGDIVSTDYVSVVGVAINTTQIYVNVTNSGVPKA